VELLQQVLVVSAGMSVWLLWVAELLRWQLGWWLLVLAAAVDSQACV
jgi:hypothetical protein